jgi:hypothetical protein
MVKRILDNGTPRKAQDALKRARPHQVIARTAQSAKPYWNPWRSETYAKDKY